MSARRVVAVIQARLGSSRFPRKSVTPFRGRPLIEHVICRVQQMSGVDEVIVTVPTSDADLIRVVTKLNDTQDESLPTTRLVYGPEKDVLWRYWLAGTAYQANGTDVEVFSMDLLSRARHARVSLTDEDREHVTTWMKRTLYPDLGIVRRKVDHLSSLKLSVDTRSDLLALETLDVDI